MNAATSVEDAVIESVLKAVYGRRAERGQPTTKLAKGAAGYSPTSYRDIKGSALG
jgi:hypothetical protein